MDTLIAILLPYRCLSAVIHISSYVSLFCKLETPKESDNLGRNHVTWQAVVLQSN